MGRVTVQNRGYNKYLHNFSAGEVEIYLNTN